MEEKIKEYVIKGGRLFTICEIETIRDGGTKIIRCTNGDSFYIHKTTDKFHLGYPTTNENLITDELLITYLLERIRVYLVRLREEYIRNENLLVKLNEKYIAG